MRYGSDNRTVVVGIGSPVLTDSAAPFEVIEVLREKEWLSNRVALKTLSAGGIDLLAELEGFSLAVVIAAFPQDAGSGGSVIETVVDAASSDRGVFSALPGDHGIEVASVLALGMQCGYSLPEKVVIIGISGANVHTVGEHCSPEIIRLVEKVTLRVEALVAEWDNCQLSYE